MQPETINSVLQTGDNKSCSILHFLTSGGIHPRLESATNTWKLLQNSFDGMINSTTWSQFISSQLTVPFLFPDVSEYEQRWLLPNETTLNFLEFGYWSETELVNLFKVYIDLNKKVLLSKNGLQSNLAVS